VTTRQLKAIQRNQDKYLRKEQRPNLRSTERAAPSVTYTALTSDSNTGGGGGGGSIVVLTIRLLTVYYGIPN
jgi:hypothetical protein